MSKGKSIDHAVLISPSFYIEWEGDLINALLSKFPIRYHISKDLATEQSIAEILNQIEGRYVQQITLHSHFHLVLAYGVGGIHYAKQHALALGDDLSSKVELYQGFGTKVSSEDCSPEMEIFDYCIATADGQSAGHSYEAIHLEAYLKKGMSSDQMDTLVDHISTRLLRI